MAKFIFDERGDYPVILFEAEQGEEIPTEMVVAWAAVRQSYMLDQIADNMIGLDNALTAIARAIES